MASVFDVAAYILKKQGSMTTMKLQKLCYYSQAWSLVWDEQPLFREHIEAWANGPVVNALYHAHNGKYTVKSGDIEGNPNNLSKDQRETIDAVLRGYGELSGQQLSDKTHAERPWKESREGLNPGDRSRTIIDTDVMQDYYGGLDTSETV